MALDPRALVTLAEARDWLNVAGTFTGGDTDIETAINDVSQRIHIEAEREFKVAGTNPQTLSFVVQTLCPTDPWYVDGQYMGRIGPKGRTVKIGDLSGNPTTVQIVSAIDWTTVLATPTVGTDVRGRPLVRDEWAPITE